MSETATLIQPSFAAGELAPALRGRVDLSKYRSGLALERNWFSLPYGGAATRPGTAIVGRCKQPVFFKPRNIPFIYSSTQTYTLEFGQFYMRVIQNGGYVLEPAIAISAIEPANPGRFVIPAHGYSVGDQIFLSGIVQPASLNSTAGFQMLVGTVLDDDVVTFTDLDGNNINTQGLAAYEGAGMAARIYTLVTPYNVRDLPLLKYAQFDDTVTLTHVLYEQSKLVRIQDFQWTLAPLSFASTVNPPTGAAAGPVNNNTANPQFDYGYVITAISDVTGEESIVSTTATCTNCALDQTKAISNKIVWVPAASGTPPSRYAIYASGPVPTNQPQQTIFGLMGTSVSCTFQDVNFTQDFTQQPPTHMNPFAPAAGQYLTITAGGASYVSPSGTVPDPDGSGMVLQLFETGGVVTNGLVIDGGANYSGSPLPITITDGGAGAGAAGNVTVGPHNGTYPGTCNFYSGRAIFAASTNQPDTIWMTQTGAYTNMDVHQIVQDDDAITVTLTSRQVNAIKHLVALNALLALTSDGCWSITGGSVTAALTPSTIVALPQAYNGCSDVPPLTIASDILYVQARGSKVRDLSYNYYIQLFTGSDLTVLAPHLFYGYEILEWAYSEEPFYQILAVRNDGQMLAFTYLKEQDIYAWSHYDTNGFYISACSIPEGQENVPYVIVERTIPGVNGGNPVYFQERQASRNFMQGGVAQASLAWCVDAGVRYGPTWIAGAGLVMAPGACIAGTADVVFKTSVATFAATDVAAQRRITANTGVALITGYVSTTEVRCTILEPFQVQPNDPDLNALPVLPGEWAATLPIAVMSGLDHLNGAIVQILVDGAVQAPQRVVDGQVILVDLGYTVLCGLGYQCQLETMPIDVGAPTIAAKQKRIPEVFVILQDSRGLKMGQARDGASGQSPKLYEIKDRSPGGTPTGVAVALHTGISRVTLASSYQRDGAVFIQQDYPLPATVLAIVPRITVGDDEG